MDIRIATEAIRIVKAAGEICLQNLGVSASSLKSDGTIVTPVDILVDHFLREELDKISPTEPYFSEESNNSISAILDGNFWLADPIDGTQPFFTGLPAWGVCLSHFSSGVLDFGAFYNPYVKEIYWSWRADSTYHRSSNLKEYLSPDSPRDWTILVNSDFHRSFDSDFPGKVRSFGCTAAHLAYVASGSVSGCLINNVSLWDIAAGLMTLNRDTTCIRYLDGSEIGYSDYACGRNMRPALVAPIKIWEDIAKTIHYPKGG